MTTSDGSAGSSPESPTAAAMAAAPRSEADSVAKAPLKAPTGVRLALVMTMSVMACALRGCARTIPRPTFMGARRAICNARNYCRRSSQASRVR